MIVNTPKYNELWYAKRPFNFRKSNTKMYLFSMNEMIACLESINSILQMIHCYDDPFTNQFNMFNNKFYIVKSLNLTLNDIIKLMMMIFVWMMMSVIMLVIIIMPSHFMSFISFNFNEIFYFFHCFIPYIFVQQN